MTFSTTALNELHSRGYIHTPLLSSDELEQLREFIRQSIHDAIGVRINDLGQYHAQVSDEQHRIMGTKHNRILKAENADKVLAFSSIKSFQSQLPGYSPTAVVYGELQKELRPEVYFRVVRPGKASDVGAAHCDRWFNELYKADFLGSISYKMWISVQTSSGLNGLYIYPGSTTHGLAYKAIATPDGPRPTPDFDLSEIGAEELMPAKPGDAIIFNDRVFHKGAVNAADTTRVSVEITMCKPDVKSAAH
jgi:hypothetical protein